MKKTHYDRVLNLIAEDNGYKNKEELLRDYGFIPTVMTPNHRKIEIISLFWKHIKK